MDKRDYLIELYDIYKLLLTESERNYFEQYFFEDYSLNEIAEVSGVSKSYVSKVINKITNKLNKYEAQLSNKKRKDKLFELVSVVSDEEIKKKIEEMLEI